MSVETPTPNNVSYKALLLLSYSENPTNFSLIRDSLLSLGNATYHKLKVFQDKILTKKKSNFIKQHVVEEPHAVCNILKVIK